MGYAARMKRERKQTKQQVKQCVLWLTNDEPMTEQNPKLVFAITKGAVNSLTDHTIVVVGKESDLQQVLTDAVGSKECHETVKRPDTIWGLRTPHTFKLDGMAEFCKQVREYGLNPVTAVPLVPHIWFRVANIG